MEHPKVGARPGMEELEKTYPWFKRAAMQLASALHLYPEREARDEVRKALREMAEFAKGERQALLDFLINQLADANRAAFESLREAFVEARLALEKEDNTTTQKVLSRALSPLCRLEEFVTNSLMALLQEGCEERVQALKDRALEVTQGDALHRLSVSVGQVADTRTAIEHAVGQRKPTTPETPEDPSSLLNLSSCFLVGAHLEEADLRGAYLREAHLEGADLMGADLMGAYLMWADLMGAYLEEARLTGAHLAGAHLEGAHLAGANWWEADFRKWVYDVKRNEWVPTEEEDEEVKRWLEANFPRPQEKEATEREGDSEDEPDALW